METVLIASETQEKVGQFESPGTHVPALGDTVRFLDPEGREKTGLIEEREWDYTRQAAGGTGGGPRLVLWISEIEAADEASNSPLHGETVPLRRSRASFAASGLGFYGELQ